MPRSTPPTLTLLSSDELVEPEALSELVARSLEGDPVGRELLARRCMPRVRRTVLLSCGPIDDADDLVQRVMVRVLTRLDSFRGEASFLVWVDRITVNEVRSHYRRRRLSLQRLFEYSQEPWPRQMDHPVTPEDQLQQRQLLDRLAHHVARLRPNQRLPVVLHMLHGYTIPEIAAMLEIEVETAKKRLQRGRRGLLQRLRRDPSCSGMHPAAMREGD